jgi:hypothetical protein
MPRSRSRKGRKHYRPRELPPALAAKDDRDYKNEARKYGLPIIGGQGSWDASVSGRFDRDMETTIPVSPDILPRKHRRYGLAKGLLEYDETGKLVKVRAR